MAVAKRQEREKPVKIEQRKVRGQVEQIAFLASPTYTGQAQGGGEDILKRGAKELGVSLSLQSTGALFFSGLWIGMPSRLEDGFSCYFLNKIEL